MKVVQSDLEKLHVDVVLSVDDSVPPTDTVAVDEEAQAIALRFQSAGVNEVVGVGGTGATVWPRALQDNQSTYKPPWIATNITSLASYVESGEGRKSLPRQRHGCEPRRRRRTRSGWIRRCNECAAIVRRAYPSDTIGSPPDPNSPQAASDSSNTPYAAVETACQDLAIFAKIAETAGKKLTVASFTEAGYRLRDVTFPGSGGPVSFGPDQPYAVGRANIVVYDARSGTLVAAPASSTLK